MVVEVEVSRVESRGGEDLRMKLGESEVATGILECFADRHDGLDAGGASAAQDFSSVRVEDRIAQVGVAVDRGSDGHGLPE